MSEPIPKWMQLRYSQLWEELKDTPFTMQDCIKILKEKKEVVAVVLSRLRKMGWLNVELNPENMRKRIYQLKHPEDIILKIAKEVEK